MTNNSLELEYGIFSDLPQKYAEMLSDSTYYSDAYGVFGYLMNCIDTINNLDWNIPGHQDRSIQFSLDYLYPLLKAGKLKMMVPIVSLRTAKTRSECDWVRNLDVSENYPIWFVDKYIIYSKSEEADDAISMVLLQWEKLKRENTPELDKLCEEKHFGKMKAVFYEHQLSFTLPDRPFWNNGEIVY